MIIVNNNKTTHLKSLVSPAGVDPPGVLLSGWGPGPGPDLGGGRVGGGSPGVLGTHRTTSTWSKAHWSLPAPA